MLQLFHVLLWSQHVKTIRYINHIISNYAWDNFSIISFSTYLKMNIHNFMFLLLKFLCATVFVSQDDKDRAIQRLSIELREAYQDSQVLNQALENSRLNSERVENEIREFKAQLEVMTSKLDQLEKILQEDEYNKTSLEIHRLITLIQTKSNDKKTLEDELEILAIEHDEAKDIFLSKHRIKLDAMNGTTID